MRLGSSMGGGPCRHGQLWKTGSRLEGAGRRQGGFSQLCRRILAVEGLVCLMSLLSFSLSPQSTR